LTDVAKILEEELAASEEKLPPRVHAAIASAVRAGNLGRAREALLAFRDERPDERRLRTRRFARAHRR